MRAASATATSDICDTTSCQVFNGSGTYTASGTRTAVEQVSTDAAITATAGVILTYQGTVALTEFAASSGGWTAPGGQPYLVGKQDPYDAVSAANSSATWQASLPVSSIENRFPAVGSLLRMVVTSRNGYGDWGGRVTGVRLEGTNGAITVTAAAWATNAAPPARSHSSRRPGSVTAATAAAATQPSECSPHRDAIRAAVMRGAVVRACCVRAMRLASPSSQRRWVSIGTGQESLEITKIDDSPVPGRRNSRPDRNCANAGPAWMAASASLGRRK